MRLRTGVMFQAWRAPVSLADPDRAPQLTRTPWGVEIMMRPGTWAIWDHRTASVVCLVDTTTRLKEIGRLT